MRVEYVVLRQKSNFSDPNLTPWSYEKKPTSTVDANEEIGTSSSSSTEEIDGRMINGEFVKSHGMNWFVSGLFLVGGIVALPTAVQQCGFIVGLIVCGVMAFVATTSAILLGRSWLVLLRLWPEYRSHCRQPYAEIGARALGPKMKSIVSICLDVTQFGICVVFFLLASKNIHDFIANFTSHGPDVCIVILIVGVILLPITFLKSPEDFWWAIVAGMCSTAIAVVLILIGAGMDFLECSKNKGEPGFKLMNLFTALGTVVFTFGGHSTFPTIQHDMRKPAEFTKSSIMAFATICVFYAPVVVIAYVTYGDSLRDSIINSIQTAWIQQAVNMMIAAHCMLTLCLMFNPLNQEAEEFFGIPQEFGIKRVLLRTGMMVAVIFTAESVPSFGPVLNLIGGSTVTLTCVIFPPVFYLFLVARERRSLQTGRDEDSCSFSEMVEFNGKSILAVCAFIVIVGLIGGVAATYSAGVEITGTHFEVPCYVKAFQHHFDNHTSTSTNCCGRYQNISVHHYNVDSFCNEPKLDFYG
ncbi:Amino acid transporter, transmembrane family-containing protein [Aphelenchoides besseyi]|nr:Amino acid transporter, transmembrane family-containing protein [Aphelenchoides besseyi]KAI6198476.1 Amino acid transporter, transmembrane family-containing protein [Aphelenchoides besseyi]